MAKSRTERINALTNKIDRWDQQIEDITAQRADAVAEIANLLGLTSTAPKSMTTSKSQPAGKLGDRIVAAMQRSYDGRTREEIAAYLNIAPQKASLSLYHLMRKGDVYEMDGKYWLKQALDIAAKTHASNNDDPV